MKNRDEIVRSWYPNETLSDDEVKAIYDTLLNLFLIFYEESRNINSEMKGEKMLTLKNNSSGTSGKKFPS